jgi:hypothetical protein
MNARTASLDSSVMVARMEVGLPLTPRSRHEGALQQIRRANPTHIFIKPLPVLAIRQSNALQYHINMGYTRRVEPAIL